MSVEAPVLPAAPKGASPAPPPFAPEVQERIVFRRIMILLIVPLYFLIVLTLKDEVKHRVAAVAGHLAIRPGPAVSALRAGYHATIVGLCALPAACAALGVVRLARRGVRPGYLVTMVACLVVGVLEGAAIALAVYRFHVSA